MNAAVQAARANEQARQACVVGMDRAAWPNWKQLPDETRAEIEAAIPDDMVLSIVGTYLSRHTTFTARLVRDRTVIAQVERAHTVDYAAWAVLRLVGVGV